MKLDEDQNNHKIKVGKYGEQIATNYLIRNGFEVVERNYLKKWGEIDIVARRTDKVHFVEVKTVSYETKADLRESISRGTHRPEENVHKYKLLKLSRIIETWIIENKYYNEWQIDVMAVRIVPREKYATLKYIPNVII